MNPKNLLLTATLALISGFAAQGTSPTLTITTSRNGAACNQAKVAEGNSASDCRTVVTVNIASDPETEGISGIFYDFTGKPWLKNSEGSDLEATASKPNNILCPNGADNNTETFTFKISGLPTDYTFNMATVTYKCCGGGGNYITSGTDTWNLTISYGTDASSLTDLGTTSNVDIIGTSSTSISATNDITISSATDGFYVMVKAVKASANNIFGLESITLRQYVASEADTDYNTAVANLEGLKATATTTLQQIGQWSDDAISTALNAVTITRDDNSISNYQTYAQEQVNAVVYSFYQQLNGKYFTFNKNKNNTVKTQPFGVISTAGTGTEGALHFSTTVDKNAVWQLIYTSENKFKLYNPATGKYVGLLNNHPTDGIYTTNQQNKYINMVDAADAAEYAITPTDYYEDNNSMTKDGLKGYVGIACTAITGVASSGVSAIMPNHLHHNATVEQDIYLWDNTCGGTNKGSWQFTSWWMNELDENTAKYLLGTYEKYPIGSNPGQYVATDAYTTAVSAVTSAAPTIPTGQDALSAFAVTDDLVSKMSAVEAITLTQNLPQTGHYLRIKTAPIWANTKFGGTQPYLSNTNNSTNAAFVDAAGVDNIFYYGANESGNTLCGYENGFYLTNSGNNLLNSTDASSNGFTTVDFIDTTAKEISTYHISFKNGTDTRYAFTATSKKTDSGSNPEYTASLEAGYRFQVEYVNELPLTLGGGVTTFDVPVAVKLPTNLGGAKAFTMALSENVLKLTEVTSSTEAIPANTALVISGGSGTVNFPIDYTATATTAEGVTANVAATVYTATDGTTSFIQNLTSATDDEAAESTGVKIGFIKLNNNDVIPANSAIVTIASTNAASQNDTFEIEVADGATYNTNTTTSIDAVAIIGENGTTAVYDLQGRRVNPSAHGIYIVNGRKLRL